MDEKQGYQKILKALEKNKEGLSITDVVNKTGLSRSYIRTALASLNGSGKIKLRKVGVSKIYSIK